MFPKYIFKKKKKVSTKVDPNSCETTEDCKIPVAVQVHSKTYVSGVRRPVFVSC